MTFRTAALALLLAGCTAVFEEPRPPEHFVAQARAVLGDVDFTLFHVPSRGLLRDTQAVDAMRRGADPEGLSAALAEVLRRGAAPPAATVAVAGGGSEKTAQVVEGAFASLGELALPQLDLLVICARQHEPAVREAARRSGCRLRLAELDG